MPYISRDDDRREKLRNGEPALIAGELNYQIFYYAKHCIISESRNRIKLEKNIKKFIKQFLGKNPNYQKYNDMTGVGIRCYKEIQRRIGISLKMLLDIVYSYDDEIAQYEDKKIIDNGDVE